MYLLSKVRDNTFLQIFLICLLALVLRVLLIDRVPNGISNDELNIILNAKAVWLQFSDITNTWNPLSLTTLPFSHPQAELPYILLSPFIGPFALSLFNARIVFVFIHTLLVLVIYGIGRTLFTKYEAFIIGLVAAINPWDIFFSKTAYESPLAILFYLCGLLLILRLKGWKILLAFIPLFLGFYCYTGAKIILLPFVFITLFYSWNVIQKKDAKPYITLLVLSVVLFLYYLVSSAYQPIQSRMSEINTPNSVKNVQIVNKMRQQSLQSKFVPLYVNKYVISLTTAAESYLNAFSTRMLFTNGEQTQTISLFYHGWFYYVDVLFLILGIYFLFRKHRKQFYFILGLVLVAPLPSVVSNQELSYALRSSLLFPVLMIVIGCGIAYAIQRFNKKGYIVILLMVYAILIGRFLTIQLLQSPVYNSEGYFFSKRIMADYVSLAGKKSTIPVIVGSGNPREQFFQYLFYTNNYSKNTAQELASNLQRNVYSLGNVQFVDCSEIDFAKNNVIVINECGKPKKLKGLTIAQLKDGGPIYSIYHDSVCTPYSTRTYPPQLSVDKLKIENLPPEEFCNSFITELLTE